MGICPEAADVLRDKHFAIGVFGELRTITAVRQIEMAKMMVVMNRFTKAYVRSLIAATPADQFVDNCKKRPRGLSDEQVLLVQRESENLEREFRLVEENFAAEYLDLVLAKDYVGALLASAVVVGYLARHHPEMLAEFQRVSDIQQAA
jgi:hypothetical protein